jgi:glycosyltransferase involved in cell wall biosynthesis
LVDDGSKDQRSQALVRKMQKQDSRLKLQCLSINSGISAASNSALKMVEAEYVVLIDQDDELTSDAFFWFVKEMNNHPESDILYSDECKIDDANFPSLSDFYFKPDWSPELLISHMYIGHLTMYRTSLIQEIGGFRSQYDFSQDYDLILRLRKKQKIYDISKGIIFLENVGNFWSSGRKRLCSYK